MKVAKFGGSSLADAAQIKKVCDIIQMDKERRVIVVSAPGKGENDPVKVTDMLIAAARETVANGKEAGEKVFAEIIGRYAKIAAELEVPSVMAQIEPALKALAAQDTADSARYEDAVKAAGEDNCAKLAAAYLASLGLPAAYVEPGAAGMLLSNEPGNAKVCPEAYDLLGAGPLRALLADGGIAVFPGFFGRTQAGEVVTFPRGGSDITGAILAAALDVEVYENFTDVDYIYSISPKYKENPKPIKTVTYREMRELSYAGFNVYQEEALFPVFHARVPVNVRSVNNPSCPGTLIVPERDASSNGLAVGIAADSGFSAISISKYMMNREVGFGRDVLQILAEEGISYEHFPSGIDDVTVIVRDAMLGDDAKCARIKAKLEALGTPENEVIVEIERNELSLIVVVGEGMKHAVGAAAAAAGALHDAGISISMISQGSSEVSMIFAVESAYCVAGVQVMYEEFFQD